MHMRRPSFVLRGRQNLLMCWLPLYTKWGGMRQDPPESRRSSKSCPLGGGVLGSVILVLLNMFDGCGMRMWL